MVESKIEVFCSYSHKDERWLEQLKRHCAPLEQRGLKLWYDRDISPGVEREKEIQAHLNSAHIILLLISPDFIVSAYAYSKEFKRAMERHSNGEARVIPVILHPCVWNLTPFGGLEALPKSGKPIATWTSKDTAFVDIAKGIWVVSQELVARNAAKAQPREKQFQDKPQGEPEGKMFHIDYDDETSELWNTLRNAIGSSIDGTKILIDAEIQRDPDRHELHRLQKLVERYQNNWHEQCFRVAVLGVPNTGKSTLINALLGTRYLHVTNVPATAATVRVRHEPTASKGRLSEKEGILAEGMDAIYAYLQTLNNQVRNQVTEQPKNELLLEAPFIALAGQSLEKQGFEILDTPGLGEAGAEALSQESGSVLGASDIIICLLNYSNLKTKQEKLLIFDELRAIRQDLLEDSSRLFFVINRFDEMKSDSMTAQDTINYVASVVLNDVAGLQVDLEQILLTAANPALLARLIENGLATEGVMQDFAAIVASSSIRKYLRPKDPMQLSELILAPTLDSCRPFVSDVLEMSGVPQLEEKIIRYLYTHSSRLFFKLLLKNVSRVLNDFCSYTEARIKVLELDREDLKGKLTNLRNDVSILLSQINQVEEDAHKYKKKVEESLKKKIHNFRKEMLEEIKEIIEDNGKIKGKDKDRVYEKLDELNEEIIEHFQRKADLFISNQERDLLAHHLELQKLVNDLTQEINQVLGETLQISIQTSNLILPNVTLRKKHVRHEAKDLIGHKNSTKYKDETITITKKDRMKENGWPDWAADLADAIAPDPQQRTVRKPLRVKTFKISRTDLQELWEEVINEKAEDWSNVLLSAVDEQISQAINIARKQLQEQTKIYSDILTHNIADSETSNSEKEHMLDEKRFCLTQITELKEQARTIVL